MKTSELIDQTLDWAVAKCEEINSQICRTNSCAEEKQGIKTHAIKYNQTWNAQGLERWSTYAPSTDWSQGGPIIEREKIDVQVSCVKGWAAYINNDELTADLYQGLGPTPLIAAMRCFVASKLGDEIEIPGELL